LDHEHVFWRKLYNQVHRQYRGVGFGK